MHHDLKIWPQYYVRVADGSKTFEVRVNDRDFKEGDTVKLMEFDTTLLGYKPDSFGFTGRTLLFKIGYVLKIDAERVVFSLIKGEG